MGKSFTVGVVTLLVSVIAIGFLVWIYYAANIGVLAYWKLDENTDSTINDDSRNGNTLSVGNNPFWLSAKSMCGGH